MMISDRINLHAIHIHEALEIKGIIIEEPLRLVQALTSVIPGAGPTITAGSAPVAPGIQMFPAVGGKSCLISAVARPNKSCAQPASTRP
jgi:hypothetical protein